MEYHDEKTIGGYEYRTRKLRFRDSRPIATELARDLAAFMRELGEGTKGVDLKDLDLSAATGGFATLIERIDDKRLARYAETFGKMSHVRVEDEGTGDVRWPTMTAQFQDEHFAGAPMRFMQWLAFVIEVNNADFFDECRNRLVPALAAAMAKVKDASASTSPSGSMETSGGSPTPGG